MECTAASWYPEKELDPLLVGMNVDSCVVGGILLTYDIYYRHASQPDAIPRNSVNSCYDYRDGIRTRFKYTYISFLSHWKINIKLFILNLLLYSFGKMQCFVNVKAGVWNFQLLYNKI